MAKPRKKHHKGRRLERFGAALFRSQNVVVVHMDLCGTVRQGLFDWKRIRNVTAGELVGSAITDYPHDWTFTVCLYWIDKLKQLQVTWLPVPAGRYKCKTLEGYVEHYKDKARLECNPGWTYLGGSWIACPYGLAFDEEVCERVFTAIGVYDLAHERRRLIKALEAA